MQAQDVCDAPHISPHSELLQALNRRWSRANCGIPLKKDSLIELHSCYTCHPRELRPGKMQMEDIWIRFHRVSKHPNHKQNSIAFQTSHAWKCLLACLPSAGQHDDWRPSRIFFLSFPFPPASLSMYQATYDWLWTVISSKMFASIVVLGEQVRNFVCFWQKGTG